MIELTPQQETLLGLLHRRATWDEITDTLGISRQGVHDTPLRALQRRGLVPSSGTLPPGAAWATVPSAEAEVAWTEFARVELARLSGEGWTGSSAVRVVGELARVGLASPPAPDDRYSRAQWSGQTLRQVNWAHQGSPLTVQGVLLPDPSGLPWQRSTPKLRSVVVWEGERMVEPVGWWLAPRGGWCPVGEVGAEVPGLPNGAYAGLTMCAAWVLEARAVLDQDALESSDG